MVRTGGGEVDVRVGAGTGAPDSIICMGHLVLPDLDLGGKQERQAEGEGQRTDAEHGRSLFDGAKFLCPSGDVNRSSKSFFTILLLVMRCGLPP